MISILFGFCDFGLIHVEAVPHRGRDSVNAGHEDLSPLLPIQLFMLGLVYFRLRKQGEYLPRLTFLGKKCV